MSEIAKVLQSEVLAQDFKNIAPDMSFDREKGFAGQLLTVNKGLRECAEKNPKSLLAAVKNVAGIGLSLSPAAKEAYLIVRGGVVCLDPSYVGLMKLATNSGSIDWCEARIVREADTFKMNSSGLAPDHDHDPFATDRGPIKGVYCVARTKTGDFLVETMSAAQITEIKSASKAANGPWKQWEEEMTRKSVIRRAFKYWPKSDERGFQRMELAVHLSNENEGFVEIVPTSPETATHTVDQKEYFDQLITNEDSEGMYVLQQTIPEGAFANLYNSFEKGAVTKYKRIVDGLLDKGRHTFHDYRSAVLGADPEDEAGIAELREEVSPDFWELVIKGV